MEKSITINQTEVMVKEYNGQRVVTLKDIDNCHGRPDGTAKRNFNANKKHFVEGVDYYKASPDEFRRTIGDMDKRQSQSVTLITESGYLILVKSFTDDFAWQVPNMLVERYFRAEDTKSKVEPSSDKLPVELQIFSNEQFGSIRTMELDGKPYFVGKDVAEVLGYSNTRDALSKHIDNEDKNTVAIHDGIQGNPNQVVINESGLYSLILSSKLPKAKEFKRWVTSEVLPTIRKHGMYATEELLNNPDLAIKVFTELREERLKRQSLEENVAVQGQQIAELKPKATYYDLVLNCKDLMSISSIAKDYGKSAIWLNDYLHDKGIQFKQGNKIWLLYQKYADKGYTSTKTHIATGADGEAHTKVHTYWTQKGRLFIYELLKNDGILPLIEQR